MSSENESLEAIKSIPDDTEVDVYLTHFCCSRGVIYKHRGIKRTAYGLPYVQMLDKSGNVTTAIVTSGDFHVSLGAAMQKAESMRLEKEKQVERRLHSIKNMKFRVKPMNRQVSYE